MLVHARNGWAEANVEHRADEVQRNCASNCNGSG